MELILPVNPLLVVAIDYHTRINR